MSADLMLISTKKGECYEQNSDKCVCIDETSGGCPHTDFGKMMVSDGFIDDDFIKKTKNWYEVLEHKDYIDIKEIIKWLKDHKGEYIESECW